MGFFDALGDAVNNKMDRMINEYKQKLRNAFDDVVRRKWEQVNDDYSADERFREATEDEMRRRGLL